MIFVVSELNNIIHIHLFFFVALRIWKEHIKDSSTLIIAPEF